MEVVPARRRGEVAPRTAGRRGIDGEAELQRIGTLHHLFLSVTTIQLRADVASARVARITQSDFLRDKSALRSEIDGDPVDQPERRRRLNPNPRSFASHSRKIKPHDLPFGQFRANARNKALPPPVRTVPHGDLQEHLARNGLLKTASLHRACSDGVVPRPGVPAMELDILAHEIVLPERVATVYDQTRFRRSRHPREFDLEPIPNVIC